VALQSVQNATSLRYQNCKVSIADGAFYRNKETVGRNLVLESRDLNPKSMLFDCERIAHGGFKILVGA
jgi:hypothetical protein